MTDEQWLWLYVNMSLDNDETLEGMCPKCRDEATSHRCSRCGKPMADTESFVNPNFDKERFDRLSDEDSATTNNPNFDAERFNKLENGGD